MRPGSYHHGRQAPGESSAIRDSSASSRGCREHSRFRQLRESRITDRGSLSRLPSLPRRGFALARTSSRAAFPVRSRLRTISSSRACAPGGDDHVPAVVETTASPLMPPDESRITKSRALRASLLAAFEFGDPSTAAATGEPRQVGRKHGTVVTIRGRIDGRDGGRGDRHRRRRQPGADASADFRAGDTGFLKQHNGDRRWDAPLTLAGLLAGRPHGRPAPLAVRYEVVDLVAARLEAVPRANLLRRVAEVEQSVQAGTLPQRVRELGEWLADEGEPGLTRTFDLWLGALAEKWGMALPSIREYEEVHAVLLERIDRWEEEILERGIKQGIEREKALLRRQAERRFGPAAAERLSAVLAAVTDADRLAEAGEWIVDCATAADFLARVEGSRP